jgi:hypothetical protein
MGNRYSCYNCFAKDPQIPDFQPPVMEYNGFSTADSSLAFPKTMSTEPIEETPTESEALSKTELIDTIANTMERFMSEVRQEPEKSGYKKVLSQNAVDVYIKDVPGGFSVMSVWRCSYPAERLARFLRLVERRKDWDTNVAECKRICNITSEIAVYYTLFKRFLTMAPRDLLIVAQHSRLEDAWVDVCTSITSSIVPETTSVVRAKMIVGGFYMQEIPTDEHGNVTLVINVSEGNFGQSLGTSLVKSMSTNLAPKFVKAVLDGMKKFEKEF